MNRIILRMISVIFTMVVCKGFAPISSGLSTHSFGFTSTSLKLAEENQVLSDGNDIIGMSITVKGDVNGGYTRTCIRNEAAIFRNLIGTMSPPGDSDTATIYVEGNRSKVESFVRWCKKAAKKMGLNQAIEVVSTNEEVATGLYDGFYVKILDDHK